VLNILPHGFAFMLPLCHGYARWCVENPAETGLNEAECGTPEEAQFVLSMNCSGAGHAQVEEARRMATRLGIPHCWWTIEDPNAFLGYVGQARAADYVFTSDKVCIPFYRKALKHDRIYWLPLAANEWMHKPLPLVRQPMAGAAVGDGDGHPAPGAGGLLDGDFLL
jgi:hypothetical protein